jgi:hypothetical protein
MRELRVRLAPGVRGYVAKVVANGHRAKDLTGSAPETADSVVPGPGRPERPLDAVSA